MTFLIKPSRNKTLQLAYQLLAEDARKAKRAAKDEEPAPPVPAKKAKKAKGK